MQVFFVTLNLAHTTVHYVSCQNRIRRGEVILQFLLRQPPVFYLNVTMIYILNLLVMCELAIPYIAEEVDQLVVDEPGLVEVVEPGHH